jgi:hypothetical protein
LSLDSDSESGSGFGFVKMIGIGVREHGHRGKQAVGWGMFFGDAKPSLRSTNAIPGVQRPKKHSPTNILPVDLWYLF